LLDPTYTFDDKINPFYGTYIIPAPGVFMPFAGIGLFGPSYTLHGGIDNMYNLSQNNVRSTVSSSGTTSYVYTLQFSKPANEPDDHYGYGSN